MDRWRRKDDLRVSARGNARSRQRGPGLRRHGRLHHSRRAFQSGDLRCPRTRRCTCTRRASCRVPERKAGSIPANAPCRGRPRPSPPSPPQPDDASGNGRADSGLPLTARTRARAGPQPTGAVRSGAFANNRPVQPGGNAGNGRLPSVAGCSTAAWMAGRTVNPFRLTPRKSLFVYPARERARLNHHQASMTPLFPSDSARRDRRFSIPAILLALIALAGGPTGALPRTLPLVRRLSGRPPSGSIPMARPSGDNPRTTAIVSIVIPPRPTRVMTSSSRGSPARHTIFSTGSEHDAR